MTHHLTLLSVLQSLETQLHEPESRHDQALITQLLHEDFSEIGRSGRQFNKQQTLEGLLAESNAPTIFATDFELALLGEGVALLTYKSFQRDEAGEPINNTLRSSLWLEAEEGHRWQLRFHQGTPSAL